MKRDAKKKRLVHQLPRANREAKKKRSINQFPRAKRQLVDRSLVLSLAIGRLVTLSKTLVLLETIAGHVSFLAQTSYWGLLIRDLEIRSNPG